MTTPSVAPDREDRNTRLVGHGLGAGGVAAVQTAGLVEAAATVMT